MRKIKATVTFKYTDELLRKLSEDTASDEEILDLARSLMAEDLSEIRPPEDFERIIVAEFVDE